MLRLGRSYQAEALRTWQLTSGDILVVSGTPKDIHLFQQMHAVELATVIEDENRTVTTIFSR